jgi:hypothetical protein
LRRHVNWGNVPSATPAVAFGGHMLFSPSACFGGTAAPMAWDLAHAPTAGLRVLCDGSVHLLNEAPEPAAEAYPDPAQCQRQRQQAAQAANEDSSGRARGIAVDPNNRGRAVMESSGASPRPPLTGPLLPCAPRHLAGLRPARSCGCLGAAPAASNSGPPARTVQDAGQCRNRNTSEHHTG